MTNSTDSRWPLVQRCINSNQFAAAQALLESIVALNPRDTSAHLHLCGLHARADRQRMAVAEALKAARDPPTDPEALGDVIAALLWVGEIATARKLLDAPTFANHQPIPVLMRAAGQRQAIGDHAAALALMQRAGAAGANGRDFLFHHAVQLAFNGQLEASRAELERCVEFDPPLGRAFIQLARMRRQNPQSNHLARIDAASRRLDPRDMEAAALEFARAKELDDLHRHDDAWRSLERANAIMRARLPCDTNKEAERFAAWMAACTPDLLHPAARVEDGGPRPIFVVGLPRSGTTLLERMLGNHSLVASAGELGDFPRSLTLATNHLAPAMFDATTIDRLQDIDWQELGMTYLSQSRWRAKGKQLYVDKLPRNWMLAGLIQRALPQARILHVVRDPMDVCYSNWRAFFGPGAEYAYAYDLVALAQHHWRYRTLMEHWHATLPGRILDVHYADLVRDPASALRNALTFCGLEYEQGCEHPERNAAPSATLSMSQIRTGVHTDRFCEWQPYAANLQRLRAELGVD